MRVPSVLRGLAATIALFSLAACSGSGEEPRTVGARSASDQRAGNSNHPKILQAYGGEVTDRALKSYVEGVGRRIASRTEQPNAKWTFTVLDSPVVNAFALPGGYVYVTRGLLALANDEAELAGVLGHEAGHVTAEHSANRQETAGLAQIGVLAATIAGAVAGLPGDAVNAIGQLGNTAAQGAVASYSRGQELEADRLGVRYIAAAGYDPEAQADFLSSLQAESDLQARIAGGAYNPNRVDFFASHPATAERVREAISAAGVAAAAEGAPRERDRYLAAIDGMIYGDSPAQGYVDGRRFAHGELRFAFEAPQGFRIQNAASRVVMAGPNGAGIVFDGGPYEGGSMERYVTSWAATLAQQARTGELTGLAARKIGGLDAASALMPAQTSGGVATLRLTAIRDGNRVWRFLGLQPQGASTLGSRMDQAALSFRKLSAAEAGALKPMRLNIHTVRAGETPASLARQTPFDDYAEARFRVLNGLGQREGLTAGRKVKLITR